jgi:hypothetical protein
LHVPADALRQVISYDIRFRESFAKVVCGKFPSARPSTLIDAVRRFDEQIKRGGEVHMLE